MTQEEYESKVQHMPHELQKIFSEALKISLSKRIVNRFMGVVLKAYAEGQRDAQKESHDGAYMRGAEDMLESLKTASSMNMTEVDYWFGINSYADCYPRMLQIFGMSADHILDATSKYNAEKARKDEEQMKSNLKTIADYIGIDRLLEIANSIKQEDELPC